MRIFFGHASDASFVRRDLKILESSHEVCARNLFHNNPFRLLHDIWCAARCELSVFWFASLRAFPSLVVSALLGKKIAVIVGGYEAASMPDMNYGQARFPVRRFLTRTMLRIAELVVAVSESSRTEIIKNLNIDEDKVALLYHGFEDMAGEIDEDREDIVVNISGINEVTWLIKGFEDFIELAEQMPELRFVHLGNVTVDCVRRLGRSLPSNLSMVGQVPYDRLPDYLTATKIYVHLSRHDSFGCAVAEAMLCGCMPIVSDAFALPEVVGDCGTVIHVDRKEDIAPAIRKALGSSPEEHRRCRQRILTHFSYERRAARLLELIEQLGDRIQPEDKTP